jgi:hypothetical protein
VLRFPYLFRATAFAVMRPRICSQALADPLPPERGELLLQSYRKSGRQCAITRVFVYIAIKDTPLS